MFKNREEAGKKLAEKLSKLGAKSVVLAIPRGGVVVGKIISQELGCPLEVLVIKKIGAPGNPELAVGAVGPDGEVAWNEEILHQLGLTAEDLFTETQNAKVKMQNYKAKFSAHGGSAFGGKIQKISLAGKTVILTDDGIATGATVEAAITWVKTQSLAKIILAVPVVPLETVEKLRNLVDELIVLETPAFFSAVGQFYEDFPQVEDGQVIKLLE